MTRRNTLGKVKKLNVDKVKMALPHYSNGRLIDSLQTTIDWYYRTGAYKK